MKTYFLMIFTLFLLSCASLKKGARVESPPDIHKLESKVRTNPDDPKAHLRLGQGYANIGRYGRALAQYDSALALDSTLAQAMVGKGWILAEEGQLEEGYSLYLKVLKGKDGEKYTEEIGRRIGCPYQIHQLTQGDFNNSFPSFSPDGERIVFQSDQDGNWEIYTMDIKGEDLRRLTDNPARDEAPVYSPNGKVIAFTSTRDDTLHQRPEEMARDIYLMDAKGGNLLRVTRNQADDWYPAFSPQGDQLAFISERDDLREVPFYEKWGEIYIINLRDDALTRLTQNQADDSSPCFSPDGKWILFCSNRGGNFQIYRMDTTGQQVQQVTNHEGNDAGPKWFPDGRKIVFFSNLNDNFDIYLTHPDGGPLLRLTQAPGLDGYPSFSPDGKKILFHSNRTGKFQLFWIDLKKPTSKEKVIEVVERVIALGGEKK